MMRMQWLPALLAVAAMLGGGERAWGQVSGSMSNIFINEFHYDNAGTDSGEAIEIAYLASATTAANLNIVLYNGSGGAVYTGVETGRTTTDGPNGFSFLTINYVSNGIQNGAPDGFALTNNGALVQFLSYEGTFTGVGGVAGGILSTDVGVAEAGTETAGMSLQLQGTGTTYGDFTFAGPIGNTFGVVNTGQSFTPVPEPATVLGIAAAGLGALRLVRRRVTG